MTAPVSEFLRLFYDVLGLIPFLMALLCCAAGCIWYQRGRIHILLERLRLSDERRLYSEEKRRDAEKQLEHLLGPGKPAFLDLRQLKRRGSRHHAHTFFTARIPPLSG